MPVQASERFWFRRASVCGARWSPGMRSARLSTPAGPENVGCVSASTTGKDGLPRRGRLGPRAVAQSRAPAPPLAAGARHRSVPGGGPEWWRSRRAGPAARSPRKQGTHGEADRQGVIVDGRRWGYALLRQRLARLRGGLCRMRELSADAFRDGRPGDGTEQCQPDRGADLLTGVEQAGGDTLVLFGHVMQGDQG